MELKLGKLPSEYDKRDLLFSDYLIKGKLPKIPNTFGHEKLIHNWQMMANDQYGCCVFASAAHQTMLWNKMAGKDVAFTDDNVLSDYAAVTGFDKNDPTSDQGTNVRDALKYRKNTGIVDSNGIRHKIGAFLALETGNHEMLWAAMYLFGLVEIGIQVPSSAIDQFRAGKIWSYVRNSPNEGGHDIPLVERRFADSQTGCLIDSVTWAKIQPMTQGFYNHQNDESFAILSPEMLKNGKSLEGFDLPALQADFKILMKG